MGVDELIYEWVMHLFGWNFKSSWPVPGLLGPKPFRPRTPRPKSIFFTGTPPPGSPRPNYKNALFVVYNGKQMNS